MSLASLEHFPEKWIPVFRKKMRSIKILARQCSRNRAADQVIGGACAGVD
jgi:hypothetical protein